MDIPLGIDKGNFSLENREGGSSTAIGLNKELLETVAALLLEADFSLAMLDRLRPVDVVLKSLWEFKLELELPKFPCKAIVEEEIGAADVEDKFFE